MCSYRELIRLCALALLCLRATSSHAQSADESDVYRETVAAAVLEFEAHDYPAAYALFARAHRLFPNARTLRGLGVVAFEAGRYLDSARYLQEALVSKQKELDGGMRQEVEQLLQRARGFVAELRFVVSPLDADVFLDGTRVDVTAPVLLDVGLHHVIAQRAGFIPARRDIDVGGGERETWNFVLEHVRQDEPRPVSVGGLAGHVVKRGRVGPLRFLPVLGGLAVGLGVTSFGITWAFSSRRTSLGDQFRISEPGRASYAVASARWHAARGRPYAFAAAGAVLATTGAAILLYQLAPGVPPWWTTALSAAAGAGLAAWGLGDIARGGPCTAVDERVCSLKQERRDHGAAIVLAAVPLLSLSLAGVLRKLRPASPSVAAWTLYPQVSIREPMLMIGARI